MAEIITEITQQHRTVEELDELIGRLVSGDVKKIFGVYRHTILKAEQKSSPNGQYLCKEIIWEVNVDQILINNYIEKKQPGGLTPSPIGCYYYRTNINGVLEEYKVLKGENQIGTLEDAMAYYFGDTITIYVSEDEWSSNFYYNFIGPNVTVTHASEEGAPYIVTVKPDAVFQQDDDNETPGYYKFQSFLTENILLFETTDIIAHEEAYIQHTYIVPPDSIKDEVENISNTFIRDDSRQKRIEMHGTMSITADASSVANAKFTYRFVVYWSDGKKTTQKRYNYLYDEDDGALFTYNKINIREGGEF